MVDRRRKQHISRRGRRLDRRTTIRVGAALCGWSLSTAALAQQAAPADTNPANDTQNIVVTAIRHKTTLLDTPLSVTVVSAATLKAIHADQFSDFAALVPGLSYTDSGPDNKRYALRGLQSAGEPEVALYYDEIPVSSVPGGSLDTGDSQPDIKLWDVDRVEVLRGPQGTLYGNGSMGGAIRIISKRPDLDKLETDQSASVGATQGGAPSFGLSSMVNAPIVSNVLAIRLTGYYRHEGGWIDEVANSQIALPQINQNNINTERTYGGRASVSYQPTSDWNITGIAYYQDMKTTAFDLYPAYATPTDRYVSKSYVREPWLDKIFMANLISTTDFGFAELTATGSYQYRKLNRTTDTTRYLLTGIYGCTEQNYDKTCFTPGIIPAASNSIEGVNSWSGEVRLVSKAPGPLQWTVGASLQDTATTRRGQIAVVDAQGNVVFDATNDAMGRLFERDNQDSFDQYALFGEVSYDITHALVATVGYRWFHSDRTDQQVIVQQFFPGAPTGPEPFQRFAQGKLFQKYELSYKLPDTGLIYVEAAQGFRAGGPNYPGGFAVTAPPYSADSVWDYEIGWKFSLLDSKVYWSGAVFHIVWNNLQQLIPTQVFSYIANVGSAHSDGFEAQLNVVPTTGLSVNAGLTYNNARLVGNQPVQTNPALAVQAGDKLANVPDWTANWSATYARDLANGSTASLRVDGSYQSGRADLVTTQNPAYFTIGSATLFARHLALDSHRAWRVGIDIDNLFNAFAPQSAKALDSNYAHTLVAARPRTATLTLNLAY